MNSEYFTVLPRDFVRVVCALSICVWNLNAQYEQIQSATTRSANQECSLYPFGVGQQTLPPFYQPEDAAQSDPRNPVAQPRIESENVDVKSTQAKNFIGLGFGGGLSSGTGILLFPVVFLNTDAVLQFHRHVGLEVFFAHQGQDSGYSGVCFAVNSIYGKISTQ